MTEPRKPCAVPEPVATKLLSHADRETRAMLALMQLANKLGRRVRHSEKEQE